MSAGLAVLRVYHSGVVTGWRARDRELRAAGVDVRLLCPQRWNEGGRVVSAEPGADAGFVTIARTWGRHPYGFVYGPITLWRELRRRRIDVLDIHEEPCSLAAVEVVVLARLAGVRAPVLFYGAQNLEKRFPVPFRWWERRMLQAAAGAHVCNDDAGRIFRARGMRGPIRTIGLGVDVERFTPAERPERRRGEALRVGYVGRLERHKGVQILIEAIARVPGAVLDVVGGGSFEPELRAMVDRLGVADRIRFEGFSSYHDLPDVYRRFDVVAVPSLTTPTWVEQFGRVPVEAMASGVPVIVSRSGSLPDVVGDAGLLAEAGDVASWAAQLGRLAGDPALWSALRRSSRARAEHYGWTSIARQQADLYREVAGPSAVVAA
jgi:glycosyltransferase involved in cell wall biosynthesis